MNTRQIIVIFCLFAVFFSALSIASAADDVDNITVSVASDENTAYGASNNDEVLQESPGTFTDLADAIQSVPAGGNISLTKDYVYSDNVNQAIVISNNMTIDGQGHTLDANNQISIFKIKTYTHVTLKNITFVNGKGFNGGAIELTPGSSIEIIDCKFINNTATNFGGAIYSVVYGATLTSTITNSIFENNTALNGGAIYLMEDKATIEGTTFTGNKAGKDGAALYVAGDYCNLANSTFTDNVAGDDGPAVYWESDNGIMYNISCLNNRGTSNGTSSSRGGSICLTGSNVTVKKSSFKNSFAGFDGGALFITGNDVNVIDTVFDNCTANDEHGGALYVIGNGVHIINCGFENCNANLSGGVIYVNGSGAVIDQVTFAGNSANLDGGALYVAGDNCILANSTFRDNVAGDDGGAIYWQGNDGIIYNITCLNNKGISDIDPIDKTRSNSKGGTICLTGSNVTISKSSFTQSSAVVDGGALFITGNNVNVIDTVFDNCTSVDTNGGALYIIGNNTNILNCDFENCNANLSGGVIYVLGNGAVINQAVFANNSANLDGAGIYVDGDDCILSNSTFEDNIAGDDGGAIYWNGDNGLIYNITCINNKGISGIDPVDKTRSNSKGGTICLTGSNVTIDQSSFTQSSAVVDGGALFITGNNVNVFNSEFSDCTSINGGGGALYIIGNYTDVINCSFSDCNISKSNATKHRGGAIYIEGNNGYIADSSFANTQALIGGAIYIAGDDTAVDNSTFSYNDATSNAGGAGGAININGANAIISNSNFAHATTKNYGGALSLWGPNAMVVNNTFDDCSAEAFQGGAIFISGANATISVSNFTRDKTTNQFTRGGAIGVQGDDANIFDCNFEDCDSYFGGTIYVSGTNAVIDGSNFKDSEAYEGGSIYVSGTHTIISKSNFTATQSRMYGGAIYVSGTDANISQSNFVDCSVEYYHGGAIYVAGENANIEKSNFTLCKGLSGLARGGAIDAEGHYTTIKDSSFDRCEAVNGGDIYVEGNYVKIENSDFNSSNATKGGAIYLSAWGAKIDGADITSCEASESGGAIYVAGGGTNIANSDFEDCIAKGTSTSNGGGAIYVSGPDTHISTSEFNNNRVPTSNDTDEARGGTIYIKGERTWIESSNFNNSCANEGGVIFIEGEKAIINSSSFANSSSKGHGGAISVNGDDATIEWSEFENIVASDNGGAIYVDGEETDILHSSFYKCSVPDDKLGGAIYINDKGTTVAYSNFNQSHAKTGGAIFIKGENTTISYCNLDNNTANSAGAIKVSGDDALISNCNFTHNVAIATDGGSLDIEGERASVFYSWFDHNAAKGNGGAINWIGGHGDDSISGCNFTNNYCNNTVSGGGAIFWTAGKVLASGGLIQDSIFINNSANGRHGGAIDWFHAKDSVVHNCLFINNYAASDGGALYTGDQKGGGYNLTITNSQFYNNTARKHGGAIANQMYASYVYNNTFDGNKAGASGGSILMKEGPARNSVIDHCYIYNSFANQTYEGNIYGEGGGAIHIADNNITISNCAIINSSINKTYGGAIVVRSNQANLVNLTIQNVQTLNGEGGAIYWSGSSGTLNNVTIFNSSSHTVDDKRAANGGAVHLSGSNCNLNNLTIFTSSSNNDNENCIKTNYGGAVYVSGSGNKLTNVEIDDSTASSVLMNTKGGAIYWEGDKGSLINATISNTLANGQGGAIYWKGGSPTIDNVSIEYSQTNVVNSTNSADGGAIYSEGINDLNNVVITNAIASTTNGDIHGGAIYYTGANMNNVTVVGSRASTDDGTSYGGAVYWIGNSDANLHNSSFNENRADLGGAIYSGRTTRIYDTSFIGNVAEKGGALYGALGDDILTNVTFELNSAKKGGAIFTDNVQIMMYDSLLRNNTAEQEGGAIYHNYADRTTSSEIKNTDIVNNTAFKGSAIFATEFVRFTLRDVVLLDNQANSNKFTNIAVGNKDGRNYTSATFVGNDNILNSIWLEGNNLDLLCNNVTYLGVPGVTTITGRPSSKNDFEVHQNVTVFMYNRNGDILDKADLITDENGQVTYIFDAQVGETYSFAYVHESDRYYTYLRESYSNSTIVKIWINNINYGENATARVEFTDMAYGKIAGNVTVKLNDTNRTTFIVEVTNITAFIYNISGLAAGHYNATIEFAGNETMLGSFNWTDFYVLPVFDLHVMKGVNVTGNYVNVTDKIEYTVTVINHGPCESNGVYVIERLSEYLKLLNSTTNNHGSYNLTNGTWYIGHLDVNETAILTITAQVIHNGPILNAVWVNGNGTDINMTNNNASARNLTAISYVDLCINKTVNVTGDVVSVLDNIEFTITVFNNGPCNATGVTVEENLDPHLKLVSYVASTGDGTYRNGTWNIGNLANNTGETLRITAQVVYSGNFSNVVTVRGFENETNYTNNRNSTRNITAVANVDVGIIKKVVGVASNTVNVTDRITFVISVYNNGPCNATGVYAGEILNPHLKLISYEATTGNGTFENATWIIGNLNKGEVHNLTIVAEVISAGIISNFVNVTSWDNDTDLSNNHDEIENITAQPIVDLRITKEVNVNGTVNVTDKVKFTITVFNAGPCDATNVNVTEKLSPLLKMLSNETAYGHYDKTKGIWYIGNLANQSTAVLTIECEITTNGTFGNVVSVNSSEIETNKSDNNDSIDNITALPIVDLQINKTVNVPSKVVNVSDEIVFTITVFNDGPCNATNVNVTERISDCLKVLSFNGDGVYNKTGGYWYIGNLTNQSTAVLTIRCEVIKSGSIENLVNVSSHENDTNMFNNHDDVAITALPIIDLQITKSANVSGKVNVTDKIEFTITVTNNGPCNATGVYVGEYFDYVHLKMISNSTTAKNSTFKGNTWYIGNLAKGEVHNLTIVAEVISVGNITNNVTVFNYENDTNMSNNNYSVKNITALPIVDLQIVKTVDVQSKQVNVGDFITFTIKVTNNGPCDATDVEVNEKLSSHLNLQYVRNSTGYYEKDKGIWHIGDLRNKYSAYLVLVCDVISPGNISNAVAVTSKENDTNESNNNDSIDNITALPVVDLSITKKSNATIFNQSDKVLFTISVFNKGPCDATHINVTEKLNHAFKLLVIDPDVGEYNETTGIWEIGILKNNTGADLRLTCELIDHGYFENEVNVTSYENDTNPYNNWYKIAIISNAIVDVSIHKEVNASGNVEVRDIIEFNITVRNDGPSDATGVYVSEILDSHLELISYNATTGNGTYEKGTWNIGNLTKNQTEKLTITARIVYEGIITNNVTVYCYQNDTNYTNNNDNITPLNATAHVDLGIIKIVNVKGAVNVTDVIEFTITVYNNGPCNATGVFVGEYFDYAHLKIIGNSTTAKGSTFDGSTWVIGNLSKGEVHNLTIIAEVIAPGNITNVVVINGTEKDRNNSNNNDSIDNITALPIVDVKVNKTVNVKVVNVTGLVEYTINVINLGPCDATDVNVTEHLSPLVEFVNARTWIGTYNNSTNIWNIPVLYKNVPVTLVLTVRVIANGTIENIVTVTSHENDTNKSNNENSSDNVTALPVVDVKVNKTVNVTVVNVTDLVEYTIVVTNVGPCNATGVVVVDKLDARLKFVSFDASRSGVSYDGVTGRCVVGNLDVNESVVLTVVARVLSVGSIPNSVNVTSNENDTNKSNNKDSSDNVTALPVVDVKINKTVSVSEARIGDNFTYIITVHNYGPSNATNVNVLEILSNYVTLVEYTASKGDYNITQNNWYVGELNNNETSTLKLVVKVISKGIIENVVYVTSNEPDKNLTNNNYTCDNVTVLSIDTPIDLDCYDIYYGDDEIITVTLPTNATGTVNITVGDRHYDNVKIDNGRVVLPVYDLGGGDYNVTVNYGGDGLYNPNSTSGTFTVYPVVPIITIEVEDIWVGEVEVLNVTVNAPGVVYVTVYGITVEISLDNGVVTTDVLAATKHDYLGNATWNIIGLPVGPYPAFALYPGNENYTSVNTTDLFHVRDKPSTVNVTADDIYVGEDAVINIKVGPEGVSGNVTVTLEGKKYILPIDENGEATLIVSGLKAGLKDVKVEYNGSIVYRPSENSTTFNVLKLKPPVDVFAPEITVGEDGVITVTVPDDATGTITIEIEGKKYTAEIKDGKAIFIVPGLKVGIHEIKAYYSGDDKYLPANTTGSIKVNPTDEPDVPKKSTIDNKLYPTGNPIMALIVVLMSLGFVQLRRFKK